MKNHHKTTSLCSIIELNRSEAQLISGGNGARITKNLLWASLASYTFNQIAFGSDPILTGAMLGISISIWLIPATIGVTIFSNSDPKIIAGALLITNVLSLAGKSYECFSNSAEAQ